MYLIGLLRGLTEVRGDSVLKVLVGLPLLFPCNFTSLFNSFSKGPGRLVRFNDRALSRTELVQCSEHG